MKRPDDPKQLVDKLCKHFLKALARAEQRNTPKIAFKASSVLIPKKQDPEKRRTNAYPLLNREEQINERANELAQSRICSPSKTTQKLTDLRNNGVTNNSN